MLTSALLLASATALFFPYEFRGKENFCSDVEKALADDVSGDRIVLPTDEEMYAASVQQYAYSSMPNGTMHPSAVVYAETTLEVQKIVRYATICGYRIAVRSGGHQYTGLSSCNSAMHKCLQVDVSQMASIEVGDTTAVVGPGVNLIDLYTKLADHGVFVPGGECDTVAVGGHAQTGGAGYYSRAFGFFADHVVAFEIVLAGGIVKRVTKPTATSLASLMSMNDRLFWAVLGGNAGSWGVATSYEVELRRDADHPHSALYFCLAPFTRDAYLQSARIINEMVSSDEWAMDTAGDEFVVINTLTRAPTDTNVMKIVGTWTGATPFNATYYNKFAAVFANTTGAQCLAFPYPISATLRDYIPMGRDREYPFPFAAKTGRGTEGPMGEDALEAVADALDSANAPYNGVYAVHQLSTFSGAGNSVENNERSPLPFRNYRLFCTVDTFYFTVLNPNAKANAEAIDKNLWDSLMTTETFRKDRRLTWSMFGDLDIENTYQYFWDDATYLKLKAIKTMVDPTEVFRSKFTIPSLIRW